MQNPELSLYSFIHSSSDSKAITQPQSSKYNSSPQNSIEKAISSIFVQQEEDNQINRTRRLLGETGKALSNEQISSITSEFQFLIDTWLTEFEKEVFHGMTLKEAIQKK